MTGIEKIGVYTPPYYIEMDDLATARGEDPAKYHLGLGQDQQAVAPVTQDAVSMAANAADTILTDADKQAIDMVLLATESGIDQSKAGAIYVHHLLGIQPHARAVEVKEACYGGTFALRTAVEHVARHPERKALVLASDIARYGLETKGEATQGAAAVALLISADATIATVNDDAVYETTDIMDFWRPNYSRTAMVDGHYSNKQYLALLQRTWQRYLTENRYTADEFAAVIFHLPYTKMGVKGLRAVFEVTDTTPAQQQRWQAALEASRVYGRRIGNGYTASLYLSLASLLDHADALRPGERLALYSYGSGAVSECFSLTLADGYRAQLHPERTKTLLDARTRLTIPQYEATFAATLPADGRAQSLDVTPDPSPYRLLGIQNHQRQYGRCDTQL